MGCFISGASEISIPFNKQKYTAVCDAEGVSWFVGGDL